jgi:hypothetical protein
MARPRHMSFGLTLLEILLVLVLVGLIVSISVPPISRQIAQRAEQAAIQEILAVISALPVRVMNAGRSVDIELLRQDAPLGERIPPQWLVEFEPILRITPAPSCNETVVIIRSQREPSFERRLRIEERTCRIQPGTLAGAN